MLLDGAEFVVHPGERVGIVGKNGAGKSTLFALLTGEIDQDAGDLSLPAGWRIASVEQEIHADERPAREFVIDGDTHLRELQARRATLGDDQGTQIAETEAALVEAGAWSAASRAEQLLAGLGFKPQEWMRPVQSFSGGWRMRLALARALMAPSELLLLDEPTNHLDLDAMLWLEKWLAAYPGTVMLISHDTEFLDAVAKSILHFDHAKLVRYRGGYNDYLTQRAERLRLGNIAYERQQREAARLQGFIDRFKAKASKAKQAQSRVKALARMQVLAPLQAEAGIDIRIPSPDQVPDPLLTLEHLSAGYTDAAGNTVPILRDVTLMVRAGSRVGVLGANGAGKSTLIKTLAEELPVQAGERRASRGLAIGYFHQHQLDMLDVDSTPLAHLARLAPEAREQELRNYLGGFGFSGDTVNGKVGPMSGGEKPGWRCRSSSGKSPTCCCWTNPATTWTWKPARPWPPRWRSLAAACCWSRTTGTCAPRWTVSGSWPMAPCASSTATWRTTATGWPRAMRASGPRRVKTRKAQIPSSTARPSAAPRPNSANASPPCASRWKPGSPRSRPRWKSCAPSCRRWMRPSPIRTCTPTNAAPNARRSWPSTANTASAWTSWKSSGWSCKARWRKSAVRSLTASGGATSPFLTAGPRAHLISIIIIIYTSSRIWL